jgi:formylmethanofuran dehydrogenase subunit B
MKPAFEVPLGDRDDDAVAVCTWRYGAAGAIDRADRGGGRFRAAEGDAVRLIDRGEVDCVVVVGEPTAHVAAAIARAAGLSVVRLPADEAALRPLAARVAAAGAAP